MASITDCVVEGLKYPFNDIKKLLGFGILFVILDLISTAFTIKTFDMTKVIVNTIENDPNLTLSSFKVSMLPNADIYFAVAAIIIGFIVALFIMGYQYNLIDFSISKKDSLPGFSDVVGMLVNGVKYFIVSFVYNIPPMIMAILAVMMMGNSSAWAVPLVISFVLIVICYFLLVMALNNMVAHDSLKKAFDLHEIIGNISNLGWGKYVGTILFTVIVFMIINVAIGLVMSFLAVVFAGVINNQAIVVSTFISIIEALFISSYCSVFFNRVCGSIYRESIK